jgi:hypothetical protein
VSIIRGGGRAAIFNGPERIALARERAAPELIVLPFASGERFELSPVGNGRKLTGKLYAGSEASPIALDVIGLRYVSPPPEPGIKRSLFGRYAVRFVSTDEPGLLVIDDARQGVSAALYDGARDYRFLEGTLDGEKLKLATFSGREGHVIEATVDRDRVIRGDVTSLDGTRDAFVARPSPDARAPDRAISAERITGAARLREALIDTRGQRARLDSFQGRARVLALVEMHAGATADLVAALRALAAQLGTVGAAMAVLTFDDADRAPAVAIADAWSDAADLPAPVFIAGPPTADTFAKHVPFLAPPVRLPVVLFVDASDTVVAGFAGVNGPASKSDHAAYVASLTSALARLGPAASSTTTAP